MQHFRVQPRPWGGRGVTDPVFEFFAGFARHAPKLDVRFDKGAGGAKQLRPASQDLRVLVPELQRAI